MTIKKWHILASIAGIALFFMVFNSFSVYAASPVITWEYDQVRPAITYNGKMNEYFVVWEDHHWGNGTDWDIYGQRIGSNGVAIGGGIGISWDGTNHRLSPAVAANGSNGEYLVVYEYEYSYTDHDIYARRISMDGSLIGSEFPITNSVYSETSPTVVYNPYSNEYLVVWKRLSGSGEFGQGDIYARRISTDGIPIGDPFVITNQALDQGAPAVAYNSVNLEYLIVWQNWVSATYEYDITGQRISNNGSLVGSQIYVSSSTNDQRKPRLAFNSTTNQYLVVWEENHVGGFVDCDIYGQIVDGNGSLINSMFSISSEGSNLRLNPTVAYNSIANEYLVSWEYVYGAQDHDIYSRRVKHDGTLIDNEIPISTSNSNEGFPAVSANGDLNYLIVWEDSRNSTSQGINIYSELISLTAFSGHVYAGNVGDESVHLGGVTVRLFCSSNTTDLGNLIAENVTNSSGYYALPLSGSCNYYNIAQVDLPGYSSAGATSIDGVFINPNLIRYSFPISGKNLSSNKFWDHPPSTTTSCSSCDDCTAKLSGPYGTVNLATNLTNISGHCIDFNTSNTTLDCQGHSISGNGNEWTYGIKLVGKTNNTIKNCTITNFETGILLQSSTHNILNNNTLQLNTNAGIQLVQSDFNTLTNNSLNQNMNGIITNFSNSNVLDTNRLCKQKEVDIYGATATVGNIQSNNQCDSNYNWNGDNSYSQCTFNCTPNSTATCSSETSCQDALKGDFNYVTLLHDISTSSGITIKGNHLTLDCGGHAIAGVGSSAGIFLENVVGVGIKNCLVTNFNNGIELRSSSLNTLQTNQIINNINGIVVSKLNLEPTGNIVTGNDISSNTNIGISLTNGRNNIISSNTIKNNNTYSLWVTGEACYNTISGNTGVNGKPLIYWHDQPGGGVVPLGNYSGIIFCNVQNGTIENITIDNGVFKNDGILIINSSKATIRNNTIRNTNGISVINSENINIYNNSEIRSNRYDAINLKGCKNCQIYSNTIQDNGGSAIYNADQSNYSLIQNNNLQKNKFGVTLKYSNNVTLNKNIIVDNYNEGIYLLGSDYCKIEDNHLRGNNNGLFLDSYTDQTDIKNNEMCYNKGSDIYNNNYNEDNTNSGQSNKCINSWNWHDSDLATSSGCKTKCVGWYQYKYGYGFQNPSKYWLSWEEFIETFGVESIFVTVDVCAGFGACVPFLGCLCAGVVIKIPTGVPDPIALGVMFPVYLTTAQPGSCTGMSNTSLRFYYKDKEPSDYNPSAKKVSELNYGGQLENDIDVSQGAIISKEIAEPYLNYQYVNNFVGKNNANNVLAQVKQGIQNGHLGTIVMSKVDSGHAVVATDVREDGNIARIFIYDNNIFRYSNDYGKTEDEYPHIKIYKDTNTWAYEPKKADYDPNPNFNVIWYAPYSLTNGKHTLPNSLDLDLGGTLLDIASSWGSADTQVEDKAGNKLGWKDGQFKLEIPHGAPMPSIGGSGYSNTQTLFMPPNDYKVHLTGRETGIYHVSFQFTNAFLLLEEVSTLLSSQDTLTFNRPNVELPLGTYTFETADVSKIYSITLGAKFSISKTLRTYSIRKASLKKSSKALFRISSDFNSIIFTNQGPDPVVFDVEFGNTMVSNKNQISDTIPKGGRSNITINPFTTLVLTPIDWLNLDQNQIIMTEEKCGNQVCGNGEDAINCPLDCPAINSPQPYDNMHITESTTFTTGTYTIADQGGDGLLMIDKDGVTLDCNGAKLLGNGTGIGISIIGKNNVVVKNCIIENYGIGIKFENNSNFKIVNSAVTSNKITGIQGISSNNSEISVNFVNENVNGIEVIGSNDTKVAQNFICGNLNLDITSSSSSNNLGTSNICKNSVGWEEQGGDGCTYVCGEFKTFLYLPIIMNN